MGLKLESPNLIKAHLKFERITSLVLTPGGSRCELRQPGTYVKNVILVFVASFDSKHFQTFLTTV